MDSINRDPAVRNEVGIRQLIQEIRRTKWHIAIVTLVAMVLAAVLGLISTPLYKASILVSPVSSAPGSGSLGAIGGALSQLGGIASLAGLGGSGDSRKNESIAVLKSEELTEKYIQQNDLLPTLYDDAWDPVRKAWKQTRPDRAPTLWKANRRFANSIRAMAVDPKSSLVTLTITWKNPRTAAQWANGLVATANEYLKNKALMESERNIAYLNEQAAKTDVVAVRQAIYSILQSEINKEMLARGSDEYAFRILDPAIAPEKASSPQKTLWVLGALIASVTGCICVLYARMSWFQD
jgi:uncharacterized protein involved in exopolysaccharide biosynthesis